MIIAFAVRGTPQPQGSIRAFMPKGWRRPVLTSDNPELKKWRKQVTKAAKAAMDQTPGARIIPKSEGVRVEAHFYFTPPKKNKAKSKTTKPDLDKLCRGLLDSLTGLYFVDDSQVTELLVRKFFGERAHTQVRVTELN